jgi:hypothetical protein
MVEAGVDIAILRIHCWQEWLGLESCIVVNNELAQHIKNIPGGF